ncbi:carboxypeptidase-like regulatory domain-containing protein [Hymenobacter sp. NST-14]|uniref:carboxypeptidase regulatory-like domain-containing protein n=1 Tax=Hymenobacter piscis TaxID=2839984 RepID=UPI001C0146DF|nr:carboxypeptidase regulatory-like domain-containing protein [Hymenobacter piscis]MBT9394354.1 carboxypeptidase-like regulatory domain-containing protein [Hymenobacter piscis]
MLFASVAGENCLNTSRTLKSIFVMRIVHNHQLRSAIFGFILSSLTPFMGQVACAQDTPVLTASNTGKVSLTGVVFSSTGQPLAGATVEVSGNKLSTASTNSEGFFLVPVEADEPITLVVSFPEHQPEQVEIKRPSGERNLVITLQSQGKQKLKALRARQKQFQRNPTR